MAQPWQRLETENEEQWASFQKFRDGPKPRKMHRPGDPPMASVSQWARDHAWFERVRAYDIWLDDLFMEEQKDIVKLTAKEITAQHMSILADTRAVIALEMSKMVADSYSSPGSGLLKPSDLTKMIDLCIKHDRLLQGEATEVIENRMDLSTMPIEDVKKIRDMLEKAKGK